MPDRHEPTLQAPLHDWSEAFAALPLESPDAGTWQRLERVHAPHRAARWPAWCAMAAALALAAVLPWQRALDDGQRDARDAPAAATPAAQAAATRMAVAQPDAAALLAQGAVARDTRSAATLPARAPSTSAAGRRQRLPSPDGARSGARTGNPAVAGLVSGDPATGRAAAVRETAVQPPVAEAAGEAQLEPLYAESARLEALLALARDDRVATGASAALAGAYEAQVASIDAALREPALPGAARSALWQQRVEALRQFAGFESTQRALAARGERYDAMLVSID